VKAFFHSDQLLHHPQSYLSRGQLRAPHEVPDRALRLLEAVKLLGLDLREPNDFGRQPLLSVHSEAYLTFLETAHREWLEIGEDWGDEVMSNIYVREPNPLRGVLAKAARYLADGSCPIGAQTWRSAYWSAQSAMAAAADVKSGAASAYGLCRPPGHHARREAAGGFSYLNTPALAAHSLRETFERVAILDVDVHHGQGVQEIFYDRDDVLYVSIHSDPTNFYPVVAGHADERGIGRGLDNNLNLPMAHGASEATFFAHLDQAVDTIDRFRASALVAAIGFDIYVDDPLGKAGVTTEGMGILGDRIAALNLPTVILQEGGYHRESLEKNAFAFFSGFLNSRRAA